MKSFAGITTALITPFKKGEVDFDSLKKLIRFQMDQGIDGFVVHGTTSESPTTTAQEKEKIFQFIKSEVAGQVFLIAGTGTNSTKDSIEKSRLAQKWGADAVLVVVPYYNKPPQRGLVEHFNQVANSIEIPTILYNVPGRTITGLDLDSVVALSQNKKIIGIKEATGDLDFGSKLVKNCKKDFMILSGDDKTCIDLAALGGQGVIGVVTHLIADKMKALYKKTKSAEVSLAKKDFEKYFQLIDSIYLEANPIPVKYALKKLGVIASEELRLPLVSLREDLRSKVDRAMEIL